MGTDTERVFERFLERMRLREDKVRMIPFEWTPRAKKPHPRQRPRRYFGRTA